MTLDEAIEVLTTENKHPWNKDNSELRAAVRLGIESLKFFKDLEDRGALPAGVRLPGETEPPPLR